VSFLVNVESFLFFALPTGLLIPFFFIEVFMFMFL